MLCIYRLKKDLRIMNSFVLGPLLMSGFVYPSLLSVVVVLLFVSSFLCFRVRKKDLQLLRAKQDELSSRDITVEQLLKENEWLIKELHHRVKNNLQIVTSLLHSQSTYLKDDAAINAIMESQHRIQAMSLIHKKLYQRESYSTVSMQEYISELVDYLMDSFKSAHNITCDLQVADIRLQIVHAVPVGLILNEILTNAMKFAFPFSDHDCITVKFFNTSPNEICLEVKDNGRGLPEDFSLNNKTSFGMLLMKGLTEELDGVFSIENSNGTAITMCFGDSSFFTGDNPLLKS
ncbi:MAG: ATP-binding protein [Bacteroidota bacterium]|nr:ATP-binding protein [Bacteroidota bacterium]